MNFFENFRKIVNMSIGKMIILKVTKNQGFTLSLGNMILEPPQGSQTDFLAAFLRLQLSDQIETTYLHYLTQLWFQTFATDVYR